jgi:hypothetical protein
MFRGGEREARVHTFAETNTLTSVTIAHKTQLLSITLSHLPCISTNIYRHHQMHPLTITRTYQCLCPCSAGEIDSGDDEDDIEVVAEEVLVENDSVRFLKAMRIETAKGTYVRAVGKRKGGDRIKLIKCSIQSLSIYL